MLNHSNKGIDIGKMSFLCIMFSLFIFMTACAEKKTIVKETTNEINWMLTDSVFTKQIDDSLKQILFTPDTVKCYHISYRDKIDEKDVEVIKDYVRDSLISILNFSQISAMQYILISNPTNYSNDTIRVQAPYLPTLEFEFRKKSFSPISIVISTLDHSWQITSRKKEIHNHNFAETSLIERFCNYFVSRYERKEDRK